MQQFITPELCEAPFGRERRRYGREIFEEEESLQNFPACCVTADPILNFDPWTQQRSVMRGSCLTQNGAWFRSQPERERVMHRGREREQESCTQRTHLSSLSFSLCRLQFCSFPPLLSLLFLFWLHKTVTPLPLCLSLSPSSGCFWSCHHRRTPPQVWIHGNEGPRHSGKESVRRRFNESEAEPPGEKCMQIICTHQKDPG